jgi:GAF domain-containing protein
MEPNAISRAEKLGLELFERACQRAVEEHLSLAWIGVVNHVQQRVVPVAYAGHEHGYLGGIYVDIKGTTPYGRGPGGSAARGVPRTSFDISRDPDFWPWRTEALSRGYRSALSLPIRLGSEVVAILTLYAPQAGHFGSWEIARFERLAESISHSLEAIVAASSPKPSNDPAKSDAERSDRKF